VELDGVLSGLSNCDSGNNATALQPSHGATSDRDSVVLYKRLKCFAKHKQLVSILKAIFSPSIARCAAIVTDMFIVLYMTWQI
jgi:hypothetical protein